jgi:hypothetical protein
MLTVYLAMKCNTLLHLLVFRNLMLRCLHGRNMWFGFMVLNATFHSISAISWWSVLLVEENGVPGETTTLLQVTDKLHNIMLYRVHLA